MQPEDVAQALIKGMKKGRYFIGPGSVMLIYRVKRFFPWLIDMVLERGIKKAQTGSNLQ